jgi:hypothetical protein
LSEAAQNFEVFSNILLLKLKSGKPIEVDDFFKAYPMIPYHSLADPIWPDGTFKLPYL